MNRGLPHSLDYANKFSTMILDGREILLDSFHRHMMEKFRSKGKAYPKPFIHRGANQISGSLNPCKDINNNDCVRDTSDVCKRCDQYSNCLLNRNIEDTAFEEDTTSSDVNVLPGNTIHKCNFKEISEDANSNCNFPPIPRRISGTKNFEIGGAGISNPIYYLEEDCNSSVGARESASEVSAHFYYQIYANDELEFPAYVNVVSSIPSSKNAPKCRTSELANNLENAEMDSSERHIYQDLDQILKRCAWSNPVYYQVNNDNFSGSFSNRQRNSFATYGCINPVKINNTAISPLARSKSMMQKPVNDTIAGVSNSDNHQMDAEYTSNIEFSEMNDTRVSFLSESIDSVCSSSWSTFAQEGSSVEIHHKVNDGNFSPKVFYYDTYSSQENSEMDISDASSTCTLVETVHHNGHMDSAGVVNSSSAIDFHDIFAEPAKSSQESCRVHGSPSQQISVLNLPWNRGSTHIVR